MHAITNVARATSPSAHDLDVATVVAYADAFCDVVRARQRDLDVRLDRVVEAREDAELAIEALREACEMAERYATFAARARAGDADPIALIQAAVAIRSLTGERTAA